MTGNVNIYVLTKTTISFCIVPWEIWLWFQMCKFPTGTGERRLRIIAFLFYQIYIDSTFWLILPHTYFSLFYSYLHLPNGFRLLCTSISDIDGILNLSFKKIPSWFKCQGITSHYCFRSCDGNKSNLANIDPYPRRHRALLGHNELIYL